MIIKAEAEDSQTSTKDSKNTFKTIAYVKFIFQLKTKTPDSQETKYLNSLEQISPDPPVTAACRGTGLEQLKIDALTDDLERLAPSDFRLVRQIACDDHRIETAVSEEIERIASRLEPHIKMQIRCDEHAVFHLMPPFATT